MPFQCSVRTLLNSHESCLCSIIISWLCHMGWGHWSLKYKSKKSCTCLKHLINVIAFPALPQWQFGSLCNQAYSHCFFFCLFCLFPSIFFTYQAHLMKSTPTWLISDVFSFRWPLRSRWIGYCISTQSVCVCECKAAVLPIQTWSPCCWWCTTHFLSLECLHCGSPPPQILPSPSQPSPLLQRTFGLKEIERDVKPIHELCNDG